MTSRHPTGYLNLLKTVYRIPIDKPEPPPKPKQKHSVQSLLENTKYDADTGCLIWQGTISNVTGYSRISINYRQYYVHRLIAFYTQVRHPGWRHFLMTNPHVLVCHTCDRPACIAPWHLVIADAQYNVWDSQAKGRRPMIDRWVYEITVNEGLQDLAFLAP